MADGGIITEDIYSGSLISVRVQTLPEPHGGTRRFEIVEHPDAVAVVALREEAADAHDAEPLVALVRQERPAIGKSTWEIPAGLVHKDERGDPDRAARRELFEETGCVAGALHLLAREYPSPGFSTEAISVYLAAGVTLFPGRDGPADPTEIAALRWVPFSEAQALAASGQIEDGKTLLGLALAREALSLAPRGDAMPMDIASPTFSRKATYQEEAPAGEGGGDNASLKLESLLMEEFGYASVTAYQAMEDRARMFNLYLLVIGIFGSALGALFQIGGDEAQPLAIIALIVAWVTGISFFIQLIRLRQAFIDSLKNMNTIKDYYFARFKAALPDPKVAFRWRMETIPKGEHTGTVTYMVCHTVAFLGSLCFGGAAFIADEVLIAHMPSAALPQLAGFQSVVAAVVLGLLSYLAHAIYFQRELNSRKARGEK